MEAVTQDVVEVADLGAGRAVPAARPIGDCDEQVAEVAEALEAPSAFGGVAVDALPLGGAPAIREQAVLVEPIKQGGRVGNVVDQHASLVAERIREGHEDVGRLRGLGEQFGGVRHGL